MELVLVPGVNNHAGTFAAMRAQLPPRHSALMLECDPLPDVDAIAARLLGKAPERFAVLGHSFGGHVALAMAAAAPGRIAGLALVNSLDRADAPDQRALRESRAQQAEQGGYPQLAEAASARAYHSLNAGRDDLLAERQRAVEAYGAQRYAAHQRAMGARPDRHAMLLARGYPLLVVAGDGDAVVPTERQLDMARATGAECAVIAQSGHMLPAEQPSALATVVSAWLDTLDTITAEA